MSQRPGRGFYGGARLDARTLMALLDYHLVEHDVQRFMICVDRDLGWAAWYGNQEPDEHRWFETQEAALLALLLGKTESVELDQG